MADVAAAKPGRLRVGCRVEETRRLLRQGDRLLVLAHVEQHDGELGADGRLSNGVVLVAQRLPEVLGSLGRQAEGTGPLGRTAKQADGPGPQLRQVRVAR